MAQPQLDGKFAAETTVDLETIKAALEAAEQELARAEAAAPAAALRVHTGKAEEGDQALLEGLPEARLNVDRLRLALAGALQAEADRKHRQRVEASNAQKRACAQHLSRARKAGEKAASALQVVARAYADMAEATRAAAACAPAQVRREYIIEQALAPERVSRLFIVEMARCVRALHVSPPRSWVIFEQDVQRHGQTVPLLELLGIYLGRVAPFLTIDKETSTVAPVEAEGAAPQLLPAEPAPLTETEKLMAEELARMKGAAA